MRVLVVNAGSSSLKLRLLDEHDRAVESVDLPAGEGGPDVGRIADAVASWDVPDALGHRVVHGGTTLTGPVLLDDEVLATLEGLTALAPLHQPKSLAGVRAMSAIFPDVPAVACFDTAFHSTMPAEATTYALPVEWRERHAIRRYGFHGLSHAYAARRAAEILGPGAPTGRVVTCHLGAGASVCAVRDGVSVDTTMGFTPLEGIVMATRSGSVDPGLVLWIMEQEGLGPADMTRVLERRSGLLGLTGTSDLREIERSAGQGDPAAQLAIDVFVRSVAAAVGSMAVATGGVDVVVFTGGVGENSTLVRSAVAARLGHLGVRLDGAANAGGPLDLDVSVPSARVRTVVVQSREDVEIGRGVRKVLG